LLKTHYTQTLPLAFVYDHSQSLAQLTILVVQYGQVSTSFPLKMITPLESYS